MTRIFLIVLMLLPGVALAQSKVMIGGVDQRIPPIENEYLAQQATRVMRQAAEAAALLTVEKRDHKDTSDRAANLQQWLDLAWPSYVGQPPE